MDNGKEVYIVGGGPSLKGFDFECLRDKQTIAVNMSVFNVPDPDYFITVDYTFLQKMGGFTKAFSMGTYPKFFVADLSHKYLVERQGCIGDIRLQLKYNLVLFDIIIKARQKEGFGFSFADFRTGMNSGYCAVQLAILLGYTKIHLLGIDLAMTDKSKSHYHDMYNKDFAFAQKLQKYYRFFKQGLVQIKNTDIKVISHSKHSLLNEIIEYKPLGDLTCL